VSVIDCRLVGQRRVLEACSRGDQGIVHQKGGLFRVRDLEHSRADRVAMRIDPEFSPEDPAATRGQLTAISRGREINLDLAINLDRARDLRIARR
jgi:hypothetical protein